MQCTVIVSLLCLTGLNNLQFNSSSLGDTAIASFGNATATIQISTDNLIALDREEVSQACNQFGACIRYHKHCISHPTYQCRYYLSRSRHDYALSVTISSSDRGGILDTESQIGVFSRLGGASKIITLSNLTTESSNESPPTRPLRR